jgi:hypothetical protein
MLGLEMVGIADGRHQQLHGQDTRTKRGGNTTLAMPNRCTQFLLLHWTLMGNRNATLNSLLLSHLPPARSSSRSQETEI